MKRISLLLTLILIIMVYGSVISAENPETLLKKADSEIFIKAPFVQNFSEKQGYVNEFVDGDVLHQYFIENGKGTDVLTSLQPSVLDVTTTNKRLKFDDKRAKTFHVSYELQRKESVPENSGYCWIRYSDTLIVGPGRESGVIVYPGYKAFSFTPVDGVMKYTEIADLSKYNVSNVITDVIRLDGITYFYFNGNFAFQYEDGITNLVSFEGGSSLFEGGNRIRCDFDNFTFSSL